MAKPTWFGYSAPFFANGDILPFMADERIIKNDLLQLLLTSPGERIMRPNFGTLLRKFPFELDDVKTIISLREAIIETIRSNEPRVIVRSVSVVPDADNHLLHVSINISLTVNPSGQFTVTLELTGNV